MKAVVKLEPKGMMMVGLVMRGDELSDLRSTLDCLRSNVLKGKCPMCDSRGALYHDLYNSLQDAVLEERKRLDRESHNRA